MTVDLAQFASLFEIGFAVHIAVAFLERIYARALPVRIERIADRINALERFKQEVQRATLRRQQAGEDTVVQFAYRRFENPEWIARNDDLLEELYVLKHYATNRLGGLRRVLGVLMVLSIGVALYSITMLFLVGLGAGPATMLTPGRASMLVLAQLLPLPTTAAVFYYVAHRMSLTVDRKLRGLCERRVLLSRPDRGSGVDYAAVEEIFRRDAGRERIAFSD